MKKLSKRILSILLSLLMVVSILPTGMITASAANGVSVRLNSLKSQYPNGKYWNHYNSTLADGADYLNQWENKYSRTVTNSPCVNIHKIPSYAGVYECNTFLGGWQCWGFANLIFYSVFGQNPNDLQTRYDYQNVQVGDWVRLYSWGDDGHSVIVTGRSGNNITVAECNYDGRCGIRWGATYSLSNAVGFHHASNYNDINNKYNNEIPTIGTPKISINTSTTVPVDTNVTIKWNAVNNANSYLVYINGKSHGTSYTYYNIQTESNKTYEIYVVAENYNWYLKSSKSNVITVKCQDNKKVRFVDYDGTLLNEQTISYGSSAKAPTNPPNRKGYVFVGWDKSFDKITSDCTITAQYKIESYNVKFYDNAGNLLKNEKVDYNQDAQPPANTNTQSGYKFVGWDTENYKNVYTDAPNKTIEIHGIYAWNNDDLPIICNISSDKRAVRQNDGYYIYFDLKNYDKAVTRGRAVVSLKTREGKLVDATESTAFSLPKNGTKTGIEVFVPCDKPATMAEIIIVDSYSSGVPISEKVETVIDQGLSWSDWSTIKPDENNGYLETETRIEYRFRDKQFATSTTSNSMDGWSLYNTTTAWSDYGSWSAWSTTKPTASDSRKVESRTTYRYHAFVSSCCRDPYSGNCDHGKPCSWKEMYYDKKGTSLGGTSVSYCSTKKYVSINGTKWWYELDGVDNGYNGKGQPSRQEYRYCDRKKVTTYHFYKWGDWSNWSANSIESTSNKEVEQRTVYRYKDNAAASENNSGVVRTASGKLDSSFAGKQITLYVYGYIGASDFTNEYIGQSVVESDGSYSFIYKLREEPSAKTGDFTVAVGIEGTNDLVTVGTIAAPKPTYTVNFYNKDGSKIKVYSNVVEGSSVNTPVINDYEGHTFTGWSESTTNIHSDLDIYPEYLTNKYTVTFINWAEQTFDTLEYEYGSKISAPIAGNVEGYTFNGWDKVVDGETIVKSNMVVTAEYKIETYTIKFYDIDGKVIDTQTVEYGESAKIPCDYSSDDLIHYGWDAVEPGANIYFVNMDMNVYPAYCFEKTTDIPTANYDSGEYNSKINLTLTTQDENAIIYYYLNDDKSTERIYTAPISVDETCTITYYASSLGKNDSSLAKKYYCINSEGVQKSWLVKIVNDNIQEHIQIVKNNERVSVADLDIIGYDLEGLYLDKELTIKYNDANVTTGLILYSKYAPKIYTVIFQNADGTVIDEQQIPYLQSAIAPSKEVMPGYILGGWDTEFDLITQDTVVTGSFFEKSEYARISLENTSLDMFTNTNAVLTPSITPINLANEDIEWSTSDSAIATVDENGVVKALAVGEATITAKVISSKETATCKINVLPALTKALILNDTSTLNYDTLGYLRRIKPRTNASNVASEFANKGIKFFSITGTELLNSDYVGTGCQIRLMNGNEVVDTKTVVVTGDMTGDGIINNRDVAMMNKYLVQKAVANECQGLAIDVNGDGYINNRDAAMLARYLVGKETL